MQSPVKYTETRQSFPTRPQKVAYGTGLFCTQDVKAGTVLEKFEGPDVKYDDISDYDKAYVLNYFSANEKEWKWLLPQTNARYANHACNPNAYINDDQELVARHPIAAGEEVTFVYNNGDEEKDYWDPIWTFDCHCGAPKCQKKIDRYRPFNKSLP